MALPELEFTLAPDSINVYNESSGTYIYQVLGVFENTSDCIKPITPVKAIKANKTSRFGEIREFNYKHTNSSHFTFAIDEYSDDDFSDGAIQSIYIAVVVSDWYYQRCKKYKNMLVDIFDMHSCAKQRIGVFDFRDLKHYEIRNNLTQSIEHAIVDRIMLKNYSKSVTSTSNAISEIVNDDGLMKVCVQFF